MHSCGDVSEWHVAGYADALHSVHSMPSAICKQHAEEEG